MSAGLALAVAVAFGACRPSGDSFGPDGRQVVRVYMLLISTRQVEFYRWAEEAFEAARPDVDIVIEQFPGSSLKDFEIKLRLRFSSGKEPDVFVASEVVTGEYARLGLLSPAPAEIERMVQENALNDMLRQAPYYADTCYGIAGDAAWQALFYNRDMFREAGLDPDRPPETWNELLEYADRLTVRDTDGRVLRAGLSLRKTGYKPGTAEKWFTFLSSAGGRPFDDEGTRATLNTEAGREAVAFYETVLFDKNIDAVDHDGDQQGFGQGRVAMFLREMHVIRWLEENYPAVDFGVAPVPARERSVSFGASYVWSVSRDSPHQDAAWEWVKFLMDDEAYTRYMDIGGILPVMKSVASQPKFSEDPHVSVFLDQEVAPPYKFPGYTRATDLLGAYIERLAYGRLDGVEMLERAENDINAILAPNRERIAQVDNE